MKSADIKPGLIHPIFRARRSRILLTFVVALVPLPFMYLVRDSDFLLLALPGAHAFGWIAATLFVSFTLFAGGRSARYRWILVAGEGNRLRVTAPTKSVINPRVQSLEGDLSDLTMSITVANLDGPAAAIATGLGKAEFSEVVFSGSAGTIRMTVVLDAYVDDYVDRFAEWKESLSPASS